MARGNMSFKAAFLLDAKQFNQGVKEIQASLRNLKGSFLEFSSAIGIGLGLGSLISNLKETSIKLSVAEQTLKNVSKTTEVYNSKVGKLTVTTDRYKENLEFVRELAKKYGQDILTLTHEFAQFTSAARALDMSLDEQKKIYESLVRAAAAYHMSEDKTRDMMVAVTQMMSKGKITAEELRRQLGNHLPGAFVLMAQAAGVSTAKLEEMMKNGDALAKDLLPKFADKLNEVTKYAHFESLQASLNNFKNAWTDFTKASNFGGFFEKLVKAGTGALSKLTDNFRQFKADIISIALSAGLLKLAQGYKTLKSKGEDWYISQNANFNSLSKQATVLKEKLDAMGFSSSKHSMYASPAKGGNFGKYEVRDLVRYNDLLISQKSLQIQLEGLTGKRKLAVKRVIDELQKQNSELVKTYGLSDNISKNFNIWKKLGKGINIVFQTVKSTIASIGITAIMSAVFGIVTRIHNCLKDLRVEAERVKNIFSDYVEESNKIDENLQSQKNEIKSYLRIVRDIRKSEGQREEALKKINEILGLAEDKQLKLSDLQKIEGGYDKITAAVKRWADATDLQNKIQQQSQIMSEAETELTKKKGELKKFRSEEQKQQLSGHITTYGPVAPNSQQIISSIKIQNITEEIRQLTTVYETAKGKVEEYTDALTKLGVKQQENRDGNKDDEKGGKKKLEGLAKVYSDYIKEQKELSRQLKEGAITQKDYNESFDKMVQSYFESAAGTGELSLDKIIEKLDNGQVLTKMEEWYLELSKLASKAITNASIRETGEILDKALKKSDKDWEEFLKKQKEKKKELEKEISKGTYNVKGPENRNSLFDYDKTSSEIISEEFDIIQDWYNKNSDSFEKLTEEAYGIVDTYGLIDDKLVELKEQMDIAKYAANSLEEAMNFSKISEDIGALQKEMDELVYGGVKDLANSMDRVVSAANNLKDTMEDTDSSGWEKFMAVFNMISQILDSAMGMYQSIQKIEENEASIGAAKLAEQEALNELLKKEVALRMAANGLSDAQIEKRMESLDAMFKESGLLQKILDLSLEEKQATVANIAAKGAEAAVTAGAASASAGEAVANATASAAKMPFPYNLPAIAASIASVLGALANMNKFAKGGIVGGNSTRGDRNISRANTGELVLNKAQQGTLYRAIASGNLGGGGGGEWRVRGTDLIKVINNTQSKLRG